MLQKKYCTVCKEEINPLRVKALPNTTTCVLHSSVERKTGYTMQYGEGEDTFNDIIIIEPEQRESFERAMQVLKNIPQTDDEFSLTELDNNNDDVEENFNPLYDLDNIDQPIDPEI